VPAAAFREQVPGVLNRYQRRTARLAAQVSAVPANKRPGLSVSRHTLLRILLKIPLPALAVPQTSGTGDFTLRRGSLYAPGPAAASTSTRAAPPTSRRSGGKTIPGPRSSAGRMRAPSRNPL
jgi:hypothetical protein